MKKKRIGLDWLALELSLRGALRNWNTSDREGRGQEDAVPTLLLVDEILAEFTRRGNEIDRCQNDKINWR